MDGWALARDWAGYLWALVIVYRRIPAVELVENLMLGMLGFALLVCVVCLALARAHKAKPKAGQQPKVIERKHAQSSAFERLLQWLWPPGDPWKVGHLLVDFTWLAHCLVWGTTGSGKSTFVMERILRSPLGLPGLVILLLWCFTGGQWPKRERRGCLVFAGNYSGPFRAACLWLMEHGYPVVIWEPEPKRGQGFGIDWLEGPPDSVGQRLIKMQPTTNGDTGLRSGAVEGMLVDTIYVIDRKREARTPGNILKYIRTVQIRDLDEDGNPVGEARPLTTQEKAGLENWCTRFGTLRRRLGACIGEDYKLSELLKAGYVVFVQGSSYTNPNSINELTNLFVYTVMWLVGSIGNFDLIIDEPGAVEKGTFTRLLTATRAKGVKIFVCPQSLEQIDKALREMCTTVLLLGTAAGAHEAQELASDMVHKDIEPVDFQLLKPVTWRDRVAFWRTRRGLRSCSGYLLDNGRLDFVKVKPVGCKYDQSNHRRRKPKHTRACRLAIIDRWPKGPIPKLHREPLEDTLELPLIPEGSEGLAREAIAQGSSTADWKGQLGEWNLDMLAQPTNGSTQSPQPAQQSSEIQSPTTAPLRSASSTQERNPPGVDWEQIAEVPMLPLLDQKMPGYFAHPDEKEHRARLQVYGHLLPLGVGRDGGVVRGLNVRGEVSACRVARDGLRKSDGRPMVSYYGSKELIYVCVYAWANNVDWASLKAMLSDKRTPVQLRPSVHHTCGHNDCAADDHLELRTVKRNSAAEPTQQRQQRAAAAAD